MSSKHEPHQIKPDPITEKLVANAFAIARRTPVAASPFLETRILAELKTRKERHSWSRQLFIWRALAATCAALTLFVVSRELLPGSGKHTFQAQARQAMVVSVEVQSLESSPIAFAEIDLPEGVSFFSKAHPELAGQRNLMIPWSPEPGKALARFPFAIRGEKTGEQLLHVRFRDSSGALVTERALHIKFNAGV